MTEITVGDTTLTGADLASIGELKVDKASDCTKSQQEQSQNAGLTAN